MLAWLAPKPFRGDQVAAGTVVLVLLVALLHVRFGGEWADGVQLAYAAAATGLVLAMAVAAPPAPGGPPAWHSTLYVCGFLLAALALGDLAVVLGSGGGAGTFVWTGTLLTALGWWMSRQRGAASGTLLGALAGIATSVALVAWVFGPDGPSTYRWLLLADALVLATMALWQRIRGPAHGVQLLNAAGLALLGIAGVFALEAVGGLLDGLFSGDSVLGDGGGVVHEPGDGIAWGWTLVMLGGGIGILSAGAADDERGNVLVGVAVLAAFLVMAGGGDLVGWPLVLAGAAAALLGVGLRPSTPLPEDPPEGTAPGGERPLPLPPPRLRPEPGDEF